MENHVSDSLARWLREQGWSERGLERLRRVWLGVDWGRRPAWTFYPSSAQERFFRGGRPGGGKRIALGEAMTNAGLRRPVATGLELCVKVPEVGGLDGDVRYVEVALRSEGVAPWYRRPWRCLRFDSHEWQRTAAGKVADRYGPLETTRHFFRWTAEWRGRRWMRRRLREK